MGIDKKIVLDKADIMDVVSRRLPANNPLKKQGPNFVARCPFHNERSASFTVSPKKGIYKCFGCGRSGDVIKFVEEFDRLDFSEALYRLQQEYNIVDPNAEPEVKYELPALRVDPIDDAFIEWLMTERRISADTIRKLRLVGSIEFLLKPKANLPVICFPYYKNDVVVNYKFRSLDKFYQLAKGCELIPYNIDSIKNTTEAIITEGEIDCATWIECGFDHATSAPNGSSSKLAPNIDWVGSWYNFKTKIILSTDDDAVGRALRDKLSARLGYHRCYWVKYPEGCKDINDVLRIHGREAVKEVYVTCYKAVPAAVYSDADGNAIEQNNPDESMTRSSVKADGSLAYKIHLPGILHWACIAGYRRYKYNDAVDSPDMIVKLDGNIISPSTDLDFVSDFLKEVEINYDQDQGQRNMLYAFASKLGTISDMLPYFKSTILSDSRYESHLYFSNGVVVVNAASYSFIDYAQLPGFVWSKHIINYEFIDTDLSTSESDFLRLLFLLTGENEQHFKAMLSAIGYLLHSYKLRTIARAVVVVEDVEDESEARGRSGKGLLAQFVEIFRHTVQQDGRNFKSDDKFRLQRIDTDTQLFYLNDPSPGLLISQFYNMITDDMLVEMKGKTAYVIPFKHSPKLLVTSNQLPLLESDSDRDRFHILTINKVFGADNTISNVFPGVLFFDRDHWPDLQFQLVYKLAIEALQFYLANGLVTYQSAEMAEKKAKRLLSTHVPDFISEPLNQALLIRQERSDPDLFAHDIKKIDLYTYQDMLEQAIKWTPKGIEIWITPFYRYATIVLKAKITQRWFGRKIAFFLSNYKNISFEHKESSATGRKVVVELI